MRENLWHTMEIEALSTALGTDPERGLSSAEVERRLQEFGPNALKEPPPRSLFSMVLEQLKEVLVLILIVAAVISGVLGEWADSLVILLIVVLNTILGVYQERKAEQALQALKRMTRPTAKVVRGGVVGEVELESLVPGDVVLLDAGDSVPADIRLTAAVSLRTNESSLTGESVPVEKDVGVLPGEEVPLGDRKNMAYMGTTVTAGHGRGIVVATGMNTQIGRIARLIQEAPQEVTPLQRRLAELGKVLGIGAGVLVLVVFLAGVRQGMDVLGMFMIAISLAVAAVPEGLPAVVTVVLALGVTRMSRRRAVVRRLSAVETLGTVTVICSDKTGTLTKNEMTVVHLYTEGRMLRVTGAGYRPVGDFVDEQETAVDPAADKNLRLLLLGGLLASDACLENGENGYRIIGDPTEGALVVAAAKAGIVREEAEREHPRLAEIPFDSDRKMMTTFNKIEDGVWSFTKGAPDVVLERCTGILQEGEFRPLDEVSKRRLLNVNSELASRGERVLALAARLWPDVPENPTSEDVERDLVFLGYFAMQDPPRPEVREAVDVCKRAGIRTVMITGDHLETAVAIARALGIWQEGDGALSGDRLQKMDDRQLEREVNRITVYARVSPEDKLRIVAALKAHNHIVAMTGDGVNDAPALKRADIGVSMGITGTEVAKEASDMVLLDDNFATIVNAVREGRTIYSNIRKSIQYLLSCNIGEIVAIFTAVLLGQGSPLTAIQILWLNLVTDSLPALALGVEPPENGVMEQPPRDPREGVLSGGVGWNILWQGAMIGLISLAVYLLALSWGRTLEEAHTMTFATMALVQLVHSFNIRSFRDSLFTIGIGTNRYHLSAFAISLSLQGMVLFIPFLRGFFDTVMLRPGDWLTVLGFSLIPLLVVEATKAFGRLKQGRLQTG